MLLIIASAMLNVHEERNAIQGERENDGTYRFSVLEMKRRP